MTTKHTSRSQILNRGIYRKFRFLLSPRTLKPRPRRKSTGHKIERNETSSGNHKETKYCGGETSPVRSIQHLVRI